MTSSLLIVNLLKSTSWRATRSLSISQIRTFPGYQKRSDFWLERVGHREMVAYGRNGMPQYFDCPEFPFPSLRFKEVNQEIMALREKERGDWKLLSIEDKKKLYRASFCQTFSEFLSPTGVWMYAVGWGLILCCVGIWLWIFIRVFLRHEVPVSFTEANKRSQLRRQIELQVDPIEGMCADWDYEKMKWKVIRWNTPPNPFSKCPKVEETVTEVKQVIQDDDDGPVVDDALEKCKAMVAEHENVIGSGPAALGDDDLDDEEECDE